MKLTVDEYIEKNTHSSSRITLSTISAQHIDDILNSIDDSLIQLQEDIESKFYTPEELSNKIDILRKKII